MKKNIKRKKLFIGISIAVFVFYIFYCVIIYQSRNKLYNTRITLRLMEYCNSILQETYGQNLGPSRDSTIEPTDGTYRQIADVYFPGIAPQTVTCFISQDKTWIGYDAKTKVLINIRGVNYAPSSFDHSRELKYSFKNTTLGELDKKYISALSIRPTKRPAFQFLSLKEVTEGVSYLDV